jgi:hypothetical protein
MTLKGSQCARHVLRVITISEEEEWSNLSWYWGWREVHLLALGCQSCKENIQPWSCTTLNIKRQVSFADQASALHWEIHFPPCPVPRASISLEDQLHPYYKAYLLRFTGYKLQCNVPKRRKGANTIDAL